MINFTNFMKFLDRCCTYLWRMWDDYWQK